MGFKRQIELFFKGTVFKRPPPAPRRRRSKAPEQGAPSDQFLLTVWLNLRSEFFPDRIELDSYEVAWSTRIQKRVLASCNIRRRRVVVARELFEPLACRWITAVLYHELCHAVIGEGVVTRGRRRQWHGPEFRELEARHPDSAALKAWIQTGGWAMAVRSHRARRSWVQRRQGSD